MLCLRCMLVGAILRTENYEQSLELPIRIDPLYLRTITWNQEGHTASKSVVASGQMDIATVDEVTNDTLCASEAISGSTHFTTSTQTAAVHYDGGTDCSEESTVTWTLDGVDQGEISGVSCSSTASGRGLLGLGLSMGLLVGFRRRD